MRAPKQATEKTCTKCGDTKRLDKFSRRNRNRDGRAEQCRACRKAYDQANAEHYAANPHVRWEPAYRHRVRQYGFEPVVEHFTRADVIARWGNACWHCDDGKFEELDHFPIPVRAGGPHTLENTRPSCTPCNRDSWKADPQCRGTGSPPGTPIGRREALLIGVAARTDVEQRDGCRLDRRPWRALFAT